MSAVAGEISREPIEEWQGPAVPEQGPRRALHGHPRRGGRLRARRRGDGLRDRRDRARQGALQGHGLHRHAALLHAVPAAADRARRRAERDRADRRRSSRRSSDGRTTTSSRNTYEAANGTIVPKASVNAIRSGYPFNLTSAPQLCSFYVDTRILPGANPLDLRDELRDVLRRGRRARARSSCSCTGPASRRRGAERLDRDGPALPRPGLRRAAGDRRRPGHEHVARHERLQRARHPGHQLRARARRATPRRKSFKVKDLHGRGRRLRADRDGPVQPGPHALDAARRAPQRGAGGRRQRSRSTPEMTDGGRKTAYITPPELPHADGLQSRRAGPHGNLLFISGQCGLDGERQNRRTWRHRGADAPGAVQHRPLARGQPGAAGRDVVKLNIYLVDMRHIDRVREIRAEHYANLGMQRAGHDERGRDGAGCRRSADRDRSDRCPVGGQGVGRWGCSSALMPVGAGRGRRWRTPRGRCWRLARVGRRTVSAEMPGGGDSRRRWRAALAPIVALVGSQACVVVRGGARAERAGARNRRCGRKSGGCCRRGTCGWRRMPASPCGARSLEERVWPCWPVRGRSRLLGRATGARHGRAVSAHLLGDEGSGYWLGRAAVAHCLAAAEGRAEPTALSPSDPRRGWAVRRRQELLGWVYGALTPVESLVDAWRRSCLVRHSRAMPLPEGSWPRRGLSWPDWLARPRIASGTGGGRRTCEWRRAAVCGALGGCCVSPLRSLWPASCPRRVSSDRVCRRRVGPSCWRWATSTQQSCPGSRQGWPRRRC